MSSLKNVSMRKMSPFRKIRNNHLRKVSLLCFRSLPCKTLKNLSEELGFNDIIRMSSPPVDSIILESEFMSPLTLDYNYYKYH